MDAQVSQPAVVGHGHCLAVDFRAQDDLTAVGEGVSPSRCQEARVIGAEDAEEEITPDVVGEDAEVVRRSPWRV